MSLNDQAAAHLSLKFGGYSDSGVKASNEDAFTAVLPSEPNVRKYKGAAACIADGVSCSDNAQVASQTAATNFVSDYFSTPDFWTVQQSASKVIGSINSWLHQQRRHDQTHSESYVTTFSALIVKSHTAHILHVGDSRIYLLRDNELNSLTEDHCYQKGGENYLTRALGIESKLDLDYHSFKVQLGDRILLTTDGVHEALSHKQLTKLAARKDNNLEKIASEIGQSALVAGSTDNISCLIVEVETLPIERIDEIYKDLTALAVPPALEVGNKIDHFEITRILHSGTRSHVYLARDTLSDERRVLKAPSLNYADDINYLESFAREQWIGRKLSSSHIMKIFAPPTGSQFLYHVCEYVEGMTLRQWITDNPQPDIQQVREVLDAMIIPVRTFHRNKLVHRDLKPDNFIINREGIITLIDFGTVQVSGIDEITPVSPEQLPVGDINYIAPEYVVYGVATNQSDLFSIATIVYEMITGALPYSAIDSNHAHQISLSKWQYKAINTLSKQPENIPNWVDHVLKKALSPNPNFRYQALSEFQSELSSPSKDTLKPKEHIPLIEQNPLYFWQALSGILVLIILFQWWYFN